VRSKSLAAGERQPELDKVPAALRIAANIAKLPALLKRPQSKSPAGAGPNKYYVRPATKPGPAPQSLLSSAPTERKRWSPVSGTR
jgi:hypothetical protein